MFKKVVPLGAVGICYLWKKADSSKLEIPVFPTFPTIKALSRNESSPRVNKNATPRQVSGTSKSAKNAIQPCKSATKKQPKLATTRIQQPTVPEESVLSIPLPIPSGNLIRQPPYNKLIISYNRHNKLANWVLEDLTPNNLEGSMEGCRNFKEDPKVKPQFRTSRSDFAMSYGDYDMAQLASTRNHMNSQKAMDETFLMSNVVPMNRQLKAETWEFLECHIRCQFVAHNENTFIVTGPLYKTRNRYATHVRYDLIKNNIPVPTHFYKIIGFRNAHGQEAYVAYIFPNEPVVISCPEDLEHFRANLPQIDVDSGFDWSTVFKTFTEVPITADKCCSPVTGCM